MKQTIKHVESNTQEKPGSKPPYGFLSVKFQAAIINDNKDFFISRIINSKGKVLKEEINVAGRFTGMETFYKKNSHFSLAATFKNGLNHGVCIKLDHNPKTLIEKLTNLWK